MEAFRVQFGHDEGMGLESRGEERAAGEEGESTEALGACGKAGQMMPSNTCQLQRDEINIEL